MTTWVRAVLAATTGVLALGGLTAPARADHGSRSTGPATLAIRTVPSTAGARVSAEGRVAVTGKRGWAFLRVQNPDALDGRFHVLATRVSANRKVEADRVVGSPSRSAKSGHPLTVGLRTSVLVHWSFVDRGGKEVPVSRVSLLEMRSNAGEVIEFRGKDLSRPRWMAAGRTQQTPRGLVNKPQYWSVTRVIVDGANVVNSGQQVFVPEQTDSWAIHLLFYRVSVVGRDLLFGSLSGKGLEVIKPDGTKVQLPFRNGKLTIPDLPRGSYDVHVFGPGMSFARPISISQDQVVELEVISPLDLWLIVAVLVLVAVSLLLVGRRHRLRRLAGGVRSRFARETVVETTGRAAVVVLLLVVGLGWAGAPAARADSGGTAGAPAAGAGAAHGHGPPPTFAYYYIWYQPTSWQRAKKDYPLLGRYASDDPVIMRRHIAMAKAAGLTGFLVSWKGRDDLDARLSTLVRTAAAQHFKLEIVYQGLDFARNPLPPATIARDLTYFADGYADDPVFDTFGRPVVVITGTEKFTVNELRRATSPVRGRLTILSSAKSVEDYRRTASVTDGDAYYWSAIDPTSPLFRSKSAQMSAAVHADGGLWFAPAPAGFDARLIGGRSVVPKQKGRTLQTSIRVARSSHPDAVGVISWNEFSENSHVEPSQRDGTTELVALARSLGGRAVVPARLHPTHVLDRETGLTGWGAILGLLLVAAAANFLIALRRRGHEGPYPLVPLPGRHVRRQAQAGARGGPVQRGSPPPSRTVLKDHERSPDEQVSHR